MLDARGATYGTMIRFSVQRFTTQNTRLSRALTSKHVITGK
jgi:hypothetical protein